MVIGCGAPCTCTACRRARSRRMLTAVGAAPELTTTRTMLFLSRNVTSDPLPCCAQPSGYFIEYAAAASRNLMKTWLSGMSPVAAEVASACRPDGEAAVEVPVVVEGVVAVVVGFVAGGTLALFELPHPESSASANAPHV